MTHCSTLDLRTELKASAGLSRLKLDGHLRKLARAATLLLVGVLDVCCTGDGLSVVHLGGARLASDIELPLESVHNDVLQQI